jgi:acetyltransferase
MRMEELARERRRDFAPAPALYQVPFRYDRIKVVAGPPSEAEWDRVWVFVRHTSREDLRWRFGHPLAFEDEATLRRAFGLNAEGEMLWALDADGAIGGICHRVPTSAQEAEIALIVRTDRKGFGIGEYLLRSVIARAAHQGLASVHASVLRDNSPMLRLAMKAGCVLRQAHGETIEIAFNIN